MWHNFFLGSELTKGYGAHGQSILARFILLRRGRSMGELPKSEVTRDEPVRMMAGGVAPEAMTDEPDHVIPGSDVTKQMQGEAKSG